jgi:hypothetical protein
MNDLPIAVITLNDIPKYNRMFKYDRLGVMAIVNRRQYCERHGYAFIHDAPVPEDRPACWSKIPAILNALDNYRWVLWADSDTLIFNFEKRIEDFCDERYDLVVQSQDNFFEVIGVPKADGLKVTPINTGVFLIQSTEWSRSFLREAYDQIQFIDKGEVWSGIGEQEAMIDLLNRNPENLRRIGYVDYLQNHPKFQRNGDMFLHFYGHYAKHRIPLGECEDVLARWESAIDRGEALPDDVARFHWVCIQNRNKASSVEHGDVERYLYTPLDIE